MQPGTRARSTRSYRFALALSGALLLLASLAVGLRVAGDSDYNSSSGGGGSKAAVTQPRELPEGGDVAPAGAGYAGYAAPPPTSLAHVAANAEVVVYGTLGRELGTQTIVFGQSTPLGEAQVVRNLGIEVRSFELKVDRYLVGSGPETLVFHKSLGGPQPEVGDSGMFFLRRPTEWKLDGFATTRSIYSIFIEAKPGVITYGDRRTPVKFLEGKTLAGVEADVQALAAP